VPTEGQAFVRKLSATERGRTINYYAPYAAEAADVLLGAIAASDGTRLPSPSTWSTFGSTTGCSEGSLSRRTGIPRRT